MKCMYNDSNSNDDNNNNNNNNDTLIEKVFPGYWSPEKDCCQ